MTDPRTHVWAIRLSNGRWFMKWGRKGRLLSAWSLAAAKNWYPSDWNNGEIVAVINTLKHKGYDADRVTLKLITE